MLKPIFDEHDASIIFERASEIKRFAEKLMVRRQGYLYSKATEIQRENFRFHAVHDIEHLAKELNALVAALEDDTWATRERVADWLKTLPRE